MALNTPSGQPSDNRLNDFAGASQPNRIGYRFSDLDPGANIYVQRDDKLVIQMMSDVTNEVINVNARLLIPGREKGRTQPDSLTLDNPLGDALSGEIISINAMVNAANISTIGTQVINLAEGYLLSIALSSTKASVRGRTYARAYILRGSNNVLNASYLLCGDYITINTPTGFPFSQYQVPTSGQGWLHIDSTQGPLIGVDPTYPAGVAGRAQVLSFSGTLTCSAAVANRIVTIQLQDQNAANRVMGTYTANAALTASQVGTITAAPGIQSSAAIPLNITINLPQPLMLQNPLTAADGWSQLAVVTVGLQAGDVWSNLEFCTQAWLDF